VKSLSISSLLESTSSSFSRVFMLLGGPDIVEVGVKLREGPDGAGVEGSERSESSSESSLESSSESSTI
jgi:hypothetical protein